MSEHLARHVLERLLVDDPRDAVALDLRAHLLACDGCKERMRAIERARAEYAAARPAGRFAAEVAARAGADRLRPLGTRLRWPMAAALATALVALALQPGIAPRDTRAIRFRGPGAQLQVYVRHDAQTRPLRDGERLSAGDQLAFTYTLLQPQHLLLFGIDDAGTITRYFPEPTLAPAALLPPGGARQLPVGIELDARRGQERLVALFSPVALDEARARDALSDALATARAHGGGVAAGWSELQLRAAQVSVWFEKP